METTEPSTLELLSRELEKITDSESCPTDVSLTELGVDSINIIEMILFCESLYGAFDPEKIEIGNFTTLADLDRQLTLLTAAEAV